MTDKEIADVIHEALSSEEGRRLMREIIGEGLTLWAQKQQSGQRPMESKTGVSRLGYVPDKIVE